MLKLLAGSVAILLIGVAVIVSGSQRPAPAPKSSSEDPGPGTNQTSTERGQYIDYYDGVIEATAGQKIIFFHAPWCPQCRALEASIKAGQIPDGVSIIKTDYDSMQSLRQKYGVTIQTTLVKVDDAGDLIKKYVAYDKPTLDNLIANLL